jgi:hypothetical protein
MPMPAPDPPAGGSFTVHRPARIHPRPALDTEIVVAAPPAAASAVGAVAWLSWLVPVLGQRQLRRVPAGRARSAPPLAARRGSRGGAGLGRGSASACGRWSGAPPAAPGGASAPATSPTWSGSLPPCGRSPPPSERSPTGSTPTFPGSGRWSTGPTASGNSGPPTPTSSTSASAPGRCRWPPRSGWTGAADRWSTTTQSCSPPPRRWSNAPPSCRRRR